MAPLTLLVILVAFITQVASRPSVQLNKVGKNTYEGYKSAPDIAAHPASDPTVRHPSPALFQPPSSHHHPASHHLILFREPNNRLIPKTPPCTIIPTTPRSTTIPPLPINTHEIGLVSR